MVIYTRTGMRFDKADLVCSHGFYKLKRSIICVALEQASCNVLNGRLTWSSIHIHACPFTPPQPAQVPTSLVAHWLLWRYHCTYLLGCHPWNRYSRISRTSSMQAAISFQVWTSLAIDTRGCPVACLGPFPLGCILPLPNCFDQQTRQ